MVKLRMLGCLVVLITPLLTVAEAFVSVESELDDFHAAAAAADFDRYFGHFAEDGVFLGTDATERWTVEEFKDYAQPSYAAGRGWTYHVLERHVNYSPDGAVAWFDERLTNANLGECRGSGVLVQKDNRWLVSQYNLTIPIPNELVDSVVALVAGEASEND